MRSTTTPPSISELRERLDGRVIAPEDDGYDWARTVFHGGIDRRPAAIVRVAKAGDVSSGRFRSSWIARTIRSSSAS
jgi:hypothetical protein